MRFTACHHVFTASLVCLCFSAHADIALPADNLLLWFDASQVSSLQLDGGKVVSWKSRAPGLEMSATSGGDQCPRFVIEAKGAVRPSVRFDGIDDVLRIPGFGRKADTWTLVAVVAPFSPAKGGGICSACPKEGHDYDPGFTVDLYQASGAFDQLSVEGAGRIGGQKDQMRASFAWGGAHVVTVVRNPESVQFFVDGEEQESRPVTPATTVMDELRIGARCYAGSERQYFHGAVLQLLLYGRAVTPDEREAVERALTVGEEERKAGEQEFVADLQRIREERMKNRMDPPQVVKSWPNVEAFLADREPKLDLSGLPVRKNLKEAIGLCMEHLNSLYDRDRDNEPFFYSNRMADGTGKMFHSVNIGIPHVVGRCLLGCMAGEMATGIRFPAEGLSILERYLKSSFDNVDNLNSYYDPEQGNARCVEFHNMREGLYGLWALIAGRDSQWARDKAHLMLETLDKITDAEGRWSVDRVKQLETGERGYGVATPNATRLVDALLAYYDATADPLAMKLAGLYAREGLKTMFLEDGRFAPMERSSGHVHSITSSLSGITDYAVRTNEQTMLDRCRLIMDKGVPEYFSSWGWGDEVFPEHPADEVSRGEINQTGDVIRTALILGDAGYPKYYEIAERYLRSMLLPTQHLESELRAYLRDKENPADDSERDVLRRTIGGYAMQHPNDRMKEGDWPLSTLDITSGAVHAMSECYRHRLSVDGDSCTLNLLLDCESDRVVIRSGLPFEGNITFEARKPIRRFSMCIPPWINPGAVQVLVAGQPRQYSLEQDRLVLGDLKPNETGTITFALPCRTEKETVDGTEYTTTWIGSQIIEILPRGEVSPLPL